MHPDRFHSGASIKPRCATAGAGRQLKWSYGVCFRKPARRSLQLETYSERQCSGGLKTAPSIDAARGACMCRQYKTLTSVSAIADNSLLSLAARSKENKSHRYQYLSYQAHNNRISSTAPRRDRSGLTWPVAEKPLIWWLAASDKLDCRFRDCGDPGGVPRTAGRQRTPPVA